MEEWKKCFEDYEISIFGNCRRNGKIIKGTIQSRGYRYFQLNREDRRKNMLFHHLVAEQFIGERPDNLVIDHIDRNKLNNNVNNLRYITIKENLQNCNKYIGDILETDKRLRTNILSKEAYRRALQKKGKDIKYRDRGTGRLVQKSNQRWNAIISIKKVRYNNTFDTLQEAEAFLLSKQS
jgi:hypothetical protein